MSKLIKKLSAFMILIMLVGSVNISPALAQDSENTEATDQSNDENSESNDSEENSEDNEQNDESSEENEQNDESDDSEEDSPTNENEGDGALIELEAEVKAALSPDATTEEIKEALAHVQEKIEEIKSGSTGGSGRATNTMRQRIERLQKMKARLRGKLVAGITAHEFVSYPKPNDVIWSVRWGVLDNRTNPCRDASREDITAALEAGETPECAMDTVKADYQGSISVNSGTLKLRNEVLFEKNDEVTTKEGSSIAFNSHIAGHWDGLILSYEPASETDGELMVTIKIGELSETLKPSQAIGKRSIGNGHTLEIKRITNVIPGLSNENREKLLEHKIKIQERLSKVKERLYRLRLLNKSGGSLDSMEEVVDETESYNFDDTSSAEVQEEIDKAIAALGDDATDEEIAALRERLKAKIEEIKGKARVRKFAKKMIPFKDTDDDQWYTEFVSKVKAGGIISGYKDANGSELGEFRPANNITIAESLKIAMEVGANGEGAGEPRMRAALNHWAKGYVKKAEELGLDITTDTDLDLNRPATRAEVIRMMLEAMGIDPETASEGSFSDVPNSHAHAKFILYAKKLGIISGDDGKDTFRPNDPVNRAEVAKIADQTDEVLVGE